MPWTPPAAEPAADPALTDAFATCLPTGGRLRGPLIAFRQIDSTQLVCRGWAAAGAPEGAMAVADHQTTGRGRQGRAWLAPPGRALLWSCLLRPPVPPRRWPELPILAGCAVAEGVEAATGLAVRLRWPNDVLVDGHKIAGILIEGVGGLAPAVILGVGVNVGQGPDEWPPDLAGRAASLAMLGAPVARPVVLAAILRHLAARYAAFLVEGFSAIRQAWRERAQLGERVVRDGIEGIAIDLGLDGALVVRRADGSLATVVAAGGA
jgi:BirA family transcriptional regulator, biotin operon repressor / biotin---[acetyl-CoA-carboxylase] ligase